MQGEHGRAEPSGRPSLDPLAESAAFRPGRSSSPGLGRVPDVGRTVVPVQGDTGTVMRGRSATATAVAAGGAVLDVGCGYRLPTIAIARHFTARCGAASITTTPRSRPRAGPASQAGVAGRVWSAQGPDTDLPRTGDARPGEVIRLTAPCLRPGGRAHAPRIREKPLSHLIGPHFVCRALRGFGVFGASVRPAGKPARP